MGVFLADAPSSAPPGPDCVPEAAHNLSLRSLHTNRARAVRLGGAALASESRAGPMRWHFHIFSLLILLRIVRTAQLLTFSLLLGAHTFASSQPARRQGRPGNSRPSWPELKARASLFAWLAATSSTTAQHTVTVTHTRIADQLDLACLISLPCLHLKLPKQQRVSVLAGNVRQTNMVPEIVVVVVVLVASAAAAPAA